MYIFTLSNKKKQHIFYKENMEENMQAFETTENNLMLFKGYRGGYYTCGKHLSYNDNQCPGCNSSTSVYRWHYEKGDSFSLYHFLKKEKTSFCIEETIITITDFMEENPIFSRSKVIVDYDYFREERLQVKVNGIKVIKKTEKLKYLSYLEMMDNTKSLFEMCGNIIDSRSLRQIVSTLDKYPEIDILYSTYGNMPFSCLLKLEDIYRGKTKPNQILGVSKYLLNTVVKENLITCQKNLDETLKIARKYVSKPDLGDAIILDALRNQIDLLDYEDLIANEKYDRIKLINYLCNDIYTFQGIKKKEGLSILKDYIKICKNLEAPYIRYPDSLKKVHDVALKNLEICIDEITQKNFRWQ